MEATTSSESELDSLKQANGKLEQETQLTRSKLEGMEKLQRENGRLSTLYKAAMTEIEDLKKQRREDWEQIRQLEDRNGDVKTRLDKALTEIVHLEQVRQQYHEADQERCAANLRISQLETVLSSTRTDLETPLASKAAPKELESLKARLSHVEERAEYFYGRKEHYKRERGVVVYALESAEAKLRTRDEDVERAKQEREEKERAQHLLKRVEMELRSKVFALGEREKENVGLRREVELLRRTGEGRIDDAVETTKRRMLAEQSVLERKIEGLEASAVTLSQELDASLKTVADLRTESNEASSIIGDLATKLKLTEQQLEALKVEVSKTPRYTSRPSTPAFSSSSNVNGLASGKENPSSSAQELARTKASLAKFATAYKALSAQYAEKTNENATVLMHFANAGDGSMGDSVR